MSVPIPPPPPDRSGIHPEKLESVSKTPLSYEPLEQVDDGGGRKQLLSMNLESAPYEFKVSSFTTTILNLLFAEAEQKGKTQYFRMCSGPGSDGSSAEKLSLDLKLIPWDTISDHFSTSERRVA